MYSNVVKVVAMNNNVVRVGGEELDGFHIETIPQVRNSFDWRAMSKLAGIRAVWILVRNGRDEQLKDLGVSDKQLLTAKALVHKYPVELSNGQAYTLARRYTWIKHASTELRLAYALRFYDRDPNARSELKKRLHMDEQVFISDIVGTDKDAAILVSQYKDQIAAAGGTIETRITYGLEEPKILIRLPHDSRVSASDLLRGEGRIVGFEKQAHVQHIPIPENATQ